MTAIAKRYATAFFEVACEQKQADLYISQLKNIGNSVQDLALWANTQIDKNSVDLVVTELGKQFQLDPVVLSFLKLLAQKKRLAFLSDIATEMENLSDRANGIVRGKVFSATELAGNRREALTDLISQKLEKRVFLEEVIDTNLKSGYRIEVAGYVLDDSFDFQMTLMKEYLLRQVEV